MDAKRMSVLVGVSVTDSDLSGFLVCLWHSRAASRRHERDSERQTMNWAKAVCCAVLCASGLSEDSLFMFVCSVYMLWDRSAASCAATGFIAISKQNRMRIVGACAVCICHLRVQWTAKRLDDGPRNECKLRWLLGAAASQMDFWVKWFYCVCGCVGAAQVPNRLRYDDDNNDNDVVSAMWCMLPVWQNCRC